MSRQYKGNSEAQKKAVMKYLNEKIEEIRVRVPKGSKEKYKSASEKAGMSLNQFMIKSADEKIERDKLL